MITIVSQPSLNIYTAYNPVLYQILAITSGALVPPIVYCDVYFDGIYYSTIANTGYSAMVGPFGQFEFDIQSKCQEYLRSVILTDEMAGGDMAGHSYEVSVLFRDTEYDTEGLITSTYTAPVAGTLFEAPVAGDGEPSDTFWIINGHTRRVDPTAAQDHINFISPQYFGGFCYGFNLSHRPNQYSTYSYKYGSGKYYVGRYDRDILAFFTPGNIVSASAFVVVYAVYKNGTTANQTKLFSTLPYTNITNTNKTHWIEAGPSTLSTFFTSLTWANIKEYTVFIGDIFKDYCIQKYYINDLTCRDRYRVLFKNILGTFDGINFIVEEEVSKTDSTTYQKTTPIDQLIVPKKKYRGLARTQVSQIDVVECWTEEYPEEDLPWLKELIGTSEAYVQIDGALNGLYDGYQLYSINILDSELVTLKKNDKYLYTVAIKFTFGNPVINLRS